MPPHVEQSLFHRTLVIAVDPAPGAAKAVFSCSRASVWQRPRHGCGFALRSLGTSSTYQRCWHAIPWGRFSCLRVSPLSPPEILEPIRRQIRVAALATYDAPGPKPSRTSQVPERNNQIRCSRQLPPTARSFEHSASATSRLFASMRTRCQFADRVDV
jgi:hypothetical protein